MQLSALLEVAITLVVTYFLLSLLCTTINELIATLLKLRGRALLRAIRGLIDDRNIRHAFFESGLIRSMEASSGGGDEDEAVPSYLDGKTFADGLLNALGASKLDFSLDGLKAKVDGLGGNRLKDSLGAILLTSAADLLGVRDGIARWFDTAMDRLSGDYGRMMKYISLALGLVLALSLNVDTIRIAYQIGQQSPQTVQQTSDLIDEINKRYPDGELPSCDDADPQKELSCRTAQAAELAGMLQVLPIGWVGDTPKGDLTTWLLLKVFGLLMTALAISLGSNFWFDILQSIINFRGAGKKPPTETDSAPKK